MRATHAFHVLGLYLDKLERAFRLDSKDMRKVYHETSRRQIDQGDYDAAVSTCHKLLELDSSDVEAHYRLGVAYMGNRSAEEAISSFQKVLRLDPKRAGAYFRLGMLYDKTGAVESSIKSYEKAIKFDGNRAEFHYTLGVALDKKGDHNTSIAMQATISLVDLSEDNTT